MTERKISAENENMSKLINGDVNYLLINDDCLNYLKTLPDETINCVITSPPYWKMRQYSIEDKNNALILGDEDKPEAYTEKIVRVFKEIKRVLKKDGSVWLNLGDKYHNKHLMGMPWRVALKMIDDGWILRNDIIWDQMKGTQSAKDRLRDVYEHIFHFVKSTKYYYSHNEIRIKPTRKAKSYNGEMVSATGVSGKKYREQILSSNTLNDDEKNSAITALDQVIQEMTDGLVVDFRMTIRGQQRTFHSNNTQISGRAKELIDKGHYILKIGSNGHLPSDIWRIAPEDKWRKDAHCAVFPEELLENPIKATCPFGGIVLDPFSGTGSTVACAIKLGRRGIGIDLSSEYIKFSQGRIDNCVLELPF